MTHESWIIVLNYQVQIHDDFQHRIAITLAKVIA